MVHIPNFLFSRVCVALDALWQHSFVCRINNWLFVLVFQLFISNIYWYIFINIVRAGTWGSCFWCPQNLVSTTSSLFLFFLEMLSTIRQPQFVKEESNANYIFHWENWFFLTYSCFQRRARKGWYTITKNETVILAVLAQIEVWDEASSTSRYIQILQKIDQTCKNYLANLEAM